jgi:hypothetical protein
MNDVKKVTYSSWGSVEMTCTRLSPLSILYIGVVPTTSNSMQLSHSQCSTPYFNTQWFGKYREALKKHKITRGNVWNFDETGFRVGCPKREEIYVPSDVKEVSYYLSNKPILIVYKLVLLC